MARRSRSPILISNELPSFLAALISFLLRGRNTEAIFQNPHQVLQFIGARAFLAELLFQLFDLLRERALIRGLRNR